MVLVADADPADVAVVAGIDGAADDGATEGIPDAAGCFPALRVTAAGAVVAALCAGCGSA